MKSFKPIYPNDRKAPRMRKGKFSMQIVTKKLWKEFKKSNPEYKNMEWSTFYKKWQEIAEVIREETITNPLGVKLGSYTGELKFQYLPYRFESIDHKTSSEVGEKIPHLNILSKNKTGTIKWERRWAVKFNKMLQFLAFEPTREMGKLAEKHASAYPEKLRISRNTLGGYSVWRQLNSEGWKKK